MLEYIAVIFAFLFAIGLSAVLLGIPKLLAPKHPSDIKSSTFECGKTPFGSPGDQMPVHFYIVAMLFIIFDVELVFLFPWAVNFRDLGIFGLVEMGLFMAFLVLGFVYVWKKKAMEWE